MDNIDNKIRAAIAAHIEQHHLEIRVGAAAVEHVAVMEGKPVAGEWESGRTEDADDDDRYRYVGESKDEIARVEGRANGRWRWDVWTRRGGRSLAYAHGFEPACEPAMAAADAWARANPERLDWQMPPAPVDGKPSDYTDAEVERMARAGCRSNDCEDTCWTGFFPGKYAIDVTRKVIAGSETPENRRFIAAVLAEKAKIDAEKMPPAREPAPHETPAACACRHAAGHVGPLTEAHGCPCGPSCPCIADETPAAPTCTVVAGCDKLATAKGGRACVDHAGMADDAPPPPPAEPHSIDHLEREVGKLADDLAEIADALPDEATGDTVADRVRSVVAMLAPPAEPPTGYEAAVRRIAAERGREVIDVVMAQLRVHQPERTAVLEKEVEKLRARPAVTPAPAPQPVSGEVAEKCYAAMESIREVMVHSKGCPAPDVDCDKCRLGSTMGVLFAHVERLAREVDRITKERNGIAQAGEKFYQKFTSEAAALRARVAELEAEMVTAGHNSAASSREAHRLQARIAELEAERAALDARLVNAAESVPTSAPPARESTNSPTGPEPEKERKRMMTITHHIIPEANSNRTVVAVDEPDPNAGGACHEYDLGYTTAEADPNAADLEREASAVTTHPLLTVRFQHGPIKEVGDNGVSEAQLLAVLIDRYEHFQAGPFASPYNAATLDALRTALDAQHQRTRDRVARDVEGRNQK